MITINARANSPLPWYDTVDEAIESGSPLTTHSTNIHTAPISYAPVAGTSPWHDTALEAAMAQIRTHEAAATSSKITGSIPPVLLASYQPATSTPAGNTPVYKGGCAENGSCHGDISARTGSPKTTYVNGYYRKNGTYVRGHYRSSSSRGKSR